MSKPIVSVISNISKIDRNHMYICVYIFLCDLWFISGRKRKYACCYIKKKLHDLNFVREFTSRTLRELSCITTFLSIQFLYNLIVVSRNLATLLKFHRRDVIMGVMASQITSSLTIVYLAFMQAQIKENIKAPRHWPLWCVFIPYRYV